MTALPGAITSLPHATYEVVRTPGGTVRKGKNVPAPELESAITFEVLTDEATITGHGFDTGAGPFFLSTTDTLPTPLEASSAAAMVGYYLIVIDADTVQLAETEEDALAEIPILFDDVDNDGLGTHTISSPFTFSIVAGVQPVTGRVTRDLPEGSSADETLVVFTTSRLFPRMGPEPGFEPDYLMIDWFGVGTEEPWYVDKCEKFTQHYRAWITRTELP